MACSIPCRTGFIFSSISLMTVSGWRCCLSPWKCCLSPWKCWSIVFNNCNDKSNYILVPLRLRRFVLAFFIYFIVNYSTPPLLFFFHRRFYLLDNIWQFFWRFLISHILILILLLLKLEVSNVRNILITIILCGVLECFLFTWFSLTFSLEVSPSEKSVENIKTIKQRKLCVITVHCSAL